MNRRRSDDSRSHKSLYLSLVMAALVATTGGVMHAMARNSQIRVERLIDQTTERIEQHHLDIQMIEVRMEKLIDRFEIKEQLEHLDSDLVPVTHGVVERVRSLPLPDPPAVAVRS